MPGPRTDYSCSELEQMEKDLVCELLECAHPGDAGWSGRNFFSPEWATDSTQYGKQVHEYLMCRQPKKQFRGNNAEVECRCSKEDSCECWLQETGCDDPDKCDTFHIGFSYVALARIAEFAQSLPYLPIKGFPLQAPNGFNGESYDIPAGSTLVWNPDVMPDNEPCDPCIKPVKGAFCLQAPEETP